MSTRTVVVSGDPVGSVMAGPAIRAVELARALRAGGHEVTVAAPVGSEAEVAGLTVTPWGDAASLAAVVDGADAVVVFAAVLADHGWLGDTGVPLVVDAYDPGLLETLEGRRGQALNAQRDWASAAARHLVAPLAMADVVLVASERQRHLVIGILAGIGRLGPRMVAEDPALDRLVRVVPFGVSGDAPPTGPSPLRGTGGVFPDDAFLALWGGGLYPWLDPVTLVEAVARTDDPRVVAAFLSGPHPTPAVGALPLVEVARSRARELGLLGQRIHFVDHWVPYAERGAWLAGGDIGVSLHHHHLETEFSFRTRVLDYLWARLPVVCTGGDVMAELVAAADLGVVVAPGDVDGVAGALDALAAAGPDERAARRVRSGVEADRRRWSEVTAPLLEVCADPRVAADRRMAEPPARGPVAALRRMLRVARGAEG